MHTNMEMQCIPNVIQNMVHHYMLTRNNPYELAYVLKDNLEQIMSTPGFSNHIWDDLIFHDEFCDGVCVNTGQGEQAEQVCTPHAAPMEQEFYTGYVDSPPSEYAPRPADDDSARDGFDVCGPYDMDYFRK